MIVSRVLFRVVKEKKKRTKKKEILSNTFDPSLRARKVSTKKVHFEKGEVVLVVSIDRFVKKRCSNNWFRYNRARKAERRRKRARGFSFGNFSRDTFVIPFVI